MVVDRSWEMAFDELAERSVRGALMVLEAQGWEHRAVVVLDADTAEFVIVPGLPAGLRRGTVSLSPDGTRLLLLARRDDGSGDERIVVHTLATGEQRVHEPRSGIVVKAALAPDGRVAALTDLFEEEGTAGIVLVDETGAERLIWSSGGCWEEAAVGWSPDGRRLAATYLSEDDVLTTVVVDRDGTTLAVLPERVALPGPHSVWLSDRELAVYPEPDDDAPIITVDIETGATHRHARDDFEGYLAQSRHRTVRPTQPTTRDHARFITTDLDDTDERPFLTVTPSITLDSLDIP